MLHRDRVNANMRYPVFIEKEHIFGVHNPGVVQDRYDTADKNQETHTVPNPGFPRIVINEDWFRWYPSKDQVVRVELGMIVGSRFKLHSPGLHARTLVILQNPVSEVKEEPGKGYQTVESSVRMGSFRATIEQLNVARKRRERL